MALPRIYYVSCVTQMGAVMMSACILVGYLVLYVGPWPWPVERRTSLLCKDCPGSSSPQHNAFFPSLIIFHISFNKRICARHWAGAGDTKLSNTDVVPTSTGMQFAEHVLSHCPHTKPGRQKSHHPCSHILDDKAKIHWSILPLVMKWKTQTQTQVF